MTVLAAYLGVPLRRFDRIEWQDGDESALFEVQLWFGDQPVRIHGAGNGEDLVVETTAWRAGAPNVACREVSAEPPHAAMIGKPLTAAEPRRLDGKPTGISLRFGDAVVHIHVEFDELWLSWGGAMPPRGCER